MTEVINLRGQSKDSYIYIGRGSMFGNKWSHIKNKETKAEFVVGTREESIERYREYFYEKIQNNKIFRRAVENLKGKRLGCYCHPLPCHGDIIKEYLDAREWFTYAHIVDGNGDPVRELLTQDEAKTRQEEIGKAAEFLSVFFPKFP